MQILDGKTSSNHLLMWQLASQPGSVHVCLERSGNAEETAGRQPCQHRNPSSCIEHLSTATPLALFTVLHLHISSFQIQHHHLGSEHGSSAGRKARQEQSPTVPSSAALHTKHTHCSSALQTPHTQQQVTVALL